MNKLRNKTWMLFGLIIAVMIILPAMSAAKEKPRRTLKIKLVADQNFAKQHVWERKAARQILDIAEEVTSLLDIDIQIVAYEVWEHEDTLDLHALTARMVKEVDYGKAEALVGFTFGPCPKKDAGGHADGVTIPYRGMMIRNYYARCPRSLFIPYVIIHEMVHLFGGVHVYDNTLMSPIFSENIMLTLDQLNQRIVSYTGSIDFNKGYSSLSPNLLDKLTAAYREAIMAGNREEVVLSELGEMYITLGKFGPAEDILEYALAQDSTFTGVWVGLGQCLKMTQSADSAIAFLETGLDYADNKGLIYARLAWLYFDKGDNEAAKLNAELARKHGTEVDAALIKRFGTGTTEDN